MSDTENTEKGYYIETEPVHELHASTRGGFSISRAAQPMLAYPGHKFEPREEYLERYGGSKDGTGLHEVLCRIHASLQDGAADIRKTDMQLLMDWAWSLHLDTVRMEQAIIRLQDALEDAAC